MYTPGFLMTRDHSGPRLYEQKIILGGVTYVIEQTIYPHHIWDEYFPDVYLIYKLYDHNADECKNFLLFVGDEKYRSRAARTTSPVIPKVIHADKATLLIGDSNLYSTDYIS